MPRPDRDGRDAARWESGWCAGASSTSQSSGLTFYLRSLDHDAPFIAIPVFPNRVFRHSCMFVNTSSGIDEPKDLAGKTIGEFGTYGQDSGVWAKGILMDDYGFKPELSRWVIGGLDSPMQPFDFIDHPHPANVDVTVAPSTQR